MKTIRRFGNVAEANFFQSLLESAGIDATLADEFAYTLGPQYVPWGIRLQVPDDEMERACRIIDTHAEFSPLPDDFVPPAEPAQAPDTIPRTNFFIDFLAGGICALFLFALAAALLEQIESTASVIRPHMYAISHGAALIFFLGGLLGLILPAIRSHLD